MRDGLVPTRRMASLMRGPLGALPQRGALVVVIGLLFVGFAAAGAAPALGVVLQVPSAAYPTIQSAIDAAAPAGDTIQVAAGTYTENLVWDTKSIALVGAGADVTVIDGNGSGSCLLMRDVPDTAVVEGFTFTGGVGTGGHTGTHYGGGLCLLHSSPRVSDNTIADNSASYFGGGLYLEGSSAVLVGNTINGNWTPSCGGGVCLKDCCSVTLVGNTITGNSTTVNAGGVYVYYSSAALQGNTITASSSGSGGGLSMVGSAVTLTANVITGNSATNWAGGIQAHGGSSPEDAPVKLVGNIIADNTAGIAGGWLSVSYAHLTLTANTIRGNSAGQCRGGLEVVQGSATLCGNTFTNNSAPGNSAIYLQQTSATLINNTVTGNSGSTGAVNTDMSSVTATNNTIASNTGGGLYCSRSTAVITNCISWGNTGWYDLAGAPATYSDVGTGWVAGEGNISVDPAFVDTAGDDYRLQDGSPCIDAGTGAAPGLPPTDQDGNPRIVGAAVDVGAYEWQGPSNLPPVAVALVNGQQSVIVDEGSCVGTTVLLDATQSDDPDGDPLTHEWDFTTDGIVDSTDAVVWVTYSLGGHAATLTVTDPAGESSTDTVSIAVVPGSPENQLANLRELILDAIASGQIAPEMEDSLLAKVDAAIAALDRGDPPGVKVVMNDLKALVNQVEAQTDKKIEPGTAAEIIARANSIIAALGA